jgi:hypothetical protein
MTPTTRKQISQPADWWAAFQRQADEAGVSLSQWLGERGIEALSAKERKGLSERRPEGRPRKEPQ